MRRLVRPLWRTHARLPREIPAPAGTLDRFALVRRRAFARNTQQAPQRPRDRLPGTPGIANLTYYGRRRVMFHLWSMEPGLQYKRSLLRALRANACFFVLKRYRGGGARFAFGFVLGRLRNLPDRHPWMKKLSNSKSLAGRLTIRHFARHYWPTQRGRSSASSVNQIGRA